MNMVGLQDAVSFLSPSSTERVAYTTSDPIVATTEIRPHRDAAEEAAADIVDSRGGGRCKNKNIDDVDKGLPSRLLAAQRITSWTCQSSTQE